MRHFLRTTQAALCATAVVVSGRPAHAQSSILWSSAGGSAWLTGTNWTGGAAPSTIDIAQFGTNPTSATTGVGINMNGATNNGTRNQAVGAIEITSARANNILIGNSSTTVGADGTLTLNGATVNAIANTILRHNGGTAAAPTTFTIQNTQGSGNRTMSVTLANAANVVQIATGTGATGAAFGNTVAITSNISGSGAAIDLRGGGGSTDRGGTLTLGGTNTFTGGISVGSSGGADAGRVRLSAAAALPTTGNITVNQNSQLQIDAAGTYGSAGQTLSLASLGAAQGSVSNISNGGLRFDPTGSNNTATFNPGVALTGNAGIHVEGATNTLVLAGAVNGGTSNSLTKTGAGTLTLAGANTSFSSIAVGGGTLRVAGSLDSSPVGVLSGGTLGGSATLNGPVTVNTGGGLAPGNSIGTTTFAAGGPSALTLFNGGTLNFEYNASATSPAAGTDNDLLLGSGTSGLSFSGVDSTNKFNINVSVFSGSPTTSSPVTYTFAQFNTISGLTAPGDVSSLFNVAGSFFGTPVVTFVDGTTDSLTIQFIPAPEPGTVLAAAAAGLGAARLVRRRRAAAA